MKTIKIIILTTVFLTAMVSVATANSVINQNISLAHKAYLEKDTKTMLLNLKTALASTGNHPLAVKNLMAMFAKSQKRVSYSADEVGWKLPKEIEYLMVENRRQVLMDNNNKVVYRLVVTGVPAKSEELETLQVLRYPNEVVIDKNSTDGGYVSDDGGFYVHAPATTNKIPEGLYLINIKTKNKPMTQGWFILSESGSSTSPEMLLPAVNQVYNTGNPTFSWKNFTSPEYKLSEKRKLKYHITDLSKPDAKVSTVEFNKEILSHQFGNNANVMRSDGPRELKNGNYTIILRFQEQSRFGDLVISRWSSTRVPFTIQR